MISRQRLVLAVPVVMSGALIGVTLMFAAVLGGAAAAGSTCASTGVSPAPVAGAPPHLRPIFDAAARRYELGTRGAAILAGLTSVESGFGKNMGPSSAGAIGWTQFMPATWAAYGVDADGDGRKDPYTAEDAIFASARYLKASGAPGDWYRALFAYNHADWYVTEVLERADELASGSGASAPAAEGNVLVVGDSLAVGTLDALRAALGTRITADVLKGRSSAAGVAVLRRIFKTGKFGAVVFDLGTNDATAQALRGSLQAVLAIVGDTRLVMATVNSPFDEHAKNQLLREFASGHSNVDLIPWHEQSQDLALTDGIHGAYNERARAFAEALNSDVGPSATCDPLTSGAVEPVAQIEGAGALVPITGAPGQLIDERIAGDVAYLIRTYRLTITAGYAPTGHAADGEHPLGLAVDIVPGPTGTWDDVDRLARWAEPTPNAPRPPFRWVGYDGDANHGRGHHLHLSWNHGPASGQRPPAPWVQAFTGTAI